MEPVWSLADNTDAMALGPFLGFRDGDANRLPFVHTFLE
jgi:hypothetical protein